jgi:hypothetical protein
MIQQGQCTIFKKSCLSGTENFAVGTPYTYKIALFPATASLGPDTLTYSSVSSEEITGTGYTAGGKSLVILPPASGGTTAFVSFVNAVWTSASFTARGALIYNGTTDSAVAVLDFGSDKTCSNTFTVTFPTADASTAILRIS